jgi:general stress protein YciG
MTGGAVNSEQPKSRRGFAAMSPEKQREIASKGGRIAHEKGAAHQWTADEAREAGRKGGTARHGCRAITPFGYVDAGEAAEPWPDA